MTTTIVENTLTDEAKNKALLEYSKLSIEDLKKRTVRPSKSNKLISLRCIAKQIGLPPKIYNDSTKGKLIENIFSLCAQYKDQSTRIDNSDKIPYKQSDIVETVSKVIYRGSDTQIGLFQYIKAALKHKDYELENYEEFLDLVYLFRPTLEKTLQVYQVEYVDSTLHSYKNHVLTHIKSLLNEHFKCDDWKPFIDKFRLKLMKTFKDISIKRTAITEKNLDIRLNSRVEVSCSELIKEAYDILSKLDTYESHNWPRVACALMIATGRRQAEIMYSAEFESTSNPYKLLYSGQLKKHDDEEYQAFEIPTLVPADMVIDGILWLKKFNKRADDPKTAHRRYSKEICASAKFIIGQKCELKSGNWTYKTTNGKEKDRKVGHLFRHLYGHACYTLFCKSNRYIAHYLTEIYGHTKTDRGVGLASQNYMADVYISDNKDDLKLAVYGS